MRDSRISLPPLVEGPVRGALRLSLGAPRWAEAAPAHLRQHAGDVAARVEWWGDASGGDLLPLPPAAAAACLSFQLRTGLKYLTRYLRDMGALTIAIEAASSSDPAAAAGGAAGDAAEREPLAVATVGLLALDVHAPISGTYPLAMVADGDGEAAGSDSIAGGGSAAPAAAAIVGSLEVRLELDFSGSSGAAALVSSFELNEHLAGSAAKGAEGEDAADSDSDGGSSCSSGDGEGLVAAAAPPAGLCEQLLVALQDRELVAAVAQQLAAGETAADEQPVAGGLQLQGCDVAHRVLPLLLPTASQLQLAYVAAMLQPFARWSSSSSSSSWEGSEEQAPTILSLEQLAAAAAEGADIERALASQPPAEALQGLRQAAAALASRSLDLAAAFAAADGQQLPLGQLGVLLQRLYPGATAEEARLLLAVVAADGVDTGAVTLLTVKAALARVQEAQQFPTAEDLARQQAAAEARRAKEAAAAAVAAIEQQRAAAAAAAKVPPSQRKQAVVSKLKSSLQERRRSSTNGHSLQAEAHAVAAPAELPSGPQQQQVPQLPAVVLGIPVLPPPPPAALMLAGQPAQPAAAQPAAEASLAHESASTDEPLEVEAAAAGSQPLELSVQPEAPRPQLERPQQAQQQDASRANGKLPPQQDALLQLIEQAEALKAAMQQAGGSASSGAPPATSTRSQLWEAAAALAAAPRLPNLLLPPGRRGSSVPAAAAEPAADPHGGLSAATAALLAAARALRLEGEQLAGVPPAAASACPALPSAAAILAPPAAPPPEGSAALLGHTAGAAGDSDAESDAEDALLDQLFFQRTQRPAGLAGAADPARAADSTEVQPAAKQPEQAAQLVLRVQLGPPRLAADSGCSGSSSSVRCVIKPLQTGGAPQQLNVPVASAAAAAPVTVELPVLGGASSSDGRPPLLPPYLFVEFWRHSGDLLGVARVPLLQPPACCAPQQGVPAVVVAEGRQPISDILEGRDAGTIHVAAVLQEQGAPLQVAAVRHCFSVAIRSAHRLPSAAAYAGAGLRAPDARLLRYSFPGEPDTLQTGEVPCCSSPSFDATATHEMTLPAGHSILPLLRDGLLRFELFDCWADQQQRQQHGWALLQLRELASLAAEAESGSNGSTAREASRTLLLPLCTEYESAGETAGAAGAGEAVARGPCLKIELSYQAQLCTMDAAEVAAAPPAAAPAEVARAGSSPVKQPRPVAEKSAAGGGGGSASDGSDGENCLLLANRSYSTSSGRQAQHAVRGRPPARAQGAAAAAQATARIIPVEPFVPATLSVEIIRACGLGAAVREAAAAAGGGAGTSLGRAAMVGPHAFVRLTLFPEADAALQAEAPPLQTAFVPQSFCPAWRSVHSYPLQLTGGMVQALASQSMRVEVWHRCPRSGAGGSGREAREVLLGAGAAPLVDVLRKPQGLRCWVPLLPGSSSGSSSSAGVVGAVQVAACLTSLGSMTSGADERESLLLRCSEAAALVPAPLRPRLLVPPGDGLSGQSAVLAVHLGTLVPPTGSSLSGRRPKADRFFCRYSLPGTDGSSFATASRVLSSVGSTAPAAALRKGGGRSGMAGSNAAEQQQQRWAAKVNHSGFFEVTADASLAAALLQGPMLLHVYKQPAGAATEGSRSAVLVGTAEVDLSSLLWADSGSSTGGDAEGAAQGQLRCVSGTYPLLEGASAAQGGASLAARVELQLQPDAGAAQQAAAATAAGAHTTALERPQPESTPAAGSGSASLLEAEQAQQQQEQPQQPVRQQPGQPPDFPLSSDEDDDEAQEELLRRCQRLAAALRGVSSPELAAAATADEAAGERSSGAAGVQPSAGSDTGQQPAEQQPAGDLHAASSGVGSAEAPQQQRASGDAGQAGSSSSPSAAVVQQDQPPGVDEPEEAGKLLMQIDSALHLPTEAPAGSNDGFSAFVVATWGQHQQRTAAVPVHVVAAAELGGTAVWHAELELPAAASAWAAQPHLSSSGASSAGPSLVLNVWATPGAPGSVSGGSGGQQPGTADSLLGCCVLDLRALPALQQLAGYWHIVDSQQRQQGQLKASVRANGALRDALQQQRSKLGYGSDAAVASPAAAPAAAAVEAPAQQHQQQRAAAAAGALDEGLLEEPEAAAGDLAQQVQAQLQDLDLLSQRLAGQPPAAEAASAEAAGGTPQQPAEQAGRSPAPAAPGAAVQQMPGAALPAARAGGDDPAVAALLAAAGPLQAGAELVKPFDDLPASDEEWDGSALPLDPRQEGLFAWSGSDSDDGMGLVGIAVDGAISGEVTEEEQEEERPRAPPRLLAEDWMFAISKTAGQPDEAEQLAAVHAAGQQQEQQPAGQPTQQRAAVRFRNVIPGGALGGAAGKDPTAPAWHLQDLAEQQQKEGEEEQAAQALLQRSSTAEAAAAAAAARSAAAVEAAWAAAAQGPTLHQFGATPAGAAPQPAPVQLQQPLPRRQQLPGGLQPGWQFDIRREAPAPSAGAAASQEQSASWQQRSSATTAATPSSVRQLDQFGAQQASGAAAPSPSVAAAGTPASLLAQQRSELQQRSQEVRSPAAAATIDEVLAQLRGGGRGAAGRSGH